MVQQNKLERKWLLNINNENTDGEAEPGSKANLATHGRSGSECQASPER